MNLSLPVESVRERDVDFLLVEEFLATPKFINYITETLNLPPCTNIRKVERSINDFGVGETDVLVEYLNGSEKLGLLIENKLDALFQPRQAERYYERAKEYVDKKTYNETFVILVAPAQYIERQNEFSLCVSYEQLMEYFKNSNLGSRGDFKIQLLKIATEKLRRGYVAVNSEINQTFWQEYREKITLDIPEITMKPVSVVPVNSDWIDLSLGHQKIVHKLAKGYIDFLKPSTEYEATLAKEFGDRFERIEFKSGNIARIHTTPLDRLAPFTDQLNQYGQFLNDFRASISLQDNS